MDSKPATILPANARVTPNGDDDFAVAPDSWLTVMNGRVFLKRDGNSIGWWFTLSAQRAAFPSKDVRVVFAADSPEVGPFASASAAREACLTLGETAVSAAMQSIKDVFAEDV